MYKPKVSNKKFQTLSKSEKKIEIAKDVIARIKSEMIELDTGTIFRNIWALPSKGSVKKYVNSKQCTVCIRGGVFCSLVGIQNNMDFGIVGGFDHVGDLTWEKDVKKIFNKRELGILEYIFESGGAEKAYMNFVKDDSWSKIRSDIKRKFDHDLNEITIFLMNHIINNNGKITLSKIKKEL